MQQGYYDISDNTELMWMKMALMATSRAEISKLAEGEVGKPSVGCVIRRYRNKGSPTCLSVGWNGFLPNMPSTHEDELKNIKGRSFEGNAVQKEQNALAAELSLHAEVNAQQYSTESPEEATVYTTHIPCYECAKQLVAHKVERVYYLYWMKGSETSIDLFEKFDITCMAFGKRKKVLYDFSRDFLNKYGIGLGSTDRETTPGECKFFLDFIDEHKITVKTLFSTEGLSWFY